MLTQGDELLATMTNMGGFMQPQGHLNLLCNMVDFGLDPQVSLSNVYARMHLHSLSVSTASQSIYPCHRSQRRRQQRLRNCAADIVSS